MQIFTHFPSFEQVDQALSRAHSQASASEAHGMLCGILCAQTKKNTSTHPIPLLTEMSGLEVSLEPQDKNVLVSLYEHTSSQLNDLSFGFQILLPEEEKPLPLRARALSQWCQGFVCGLGLGGLQSFHIKSSEDVYEALVRISDIAQLNHEQINTTDSDETAYTEIVEYVRLAVMAVYEEVSGQPTSTVLRKGNKTVH